MECVIYVCVTGDRVLVITPTRYHLFLVTYQSRRGDGVICFTRVKPSTQGRVPASQTGAKSLLITRSDERSLVELNI